MSKKNICLVLFLTLVPGHFLRGSEQGAVSLRLVGPLSQNESVFLDQAVGYAQSGDQFRLNELLLGSSANGSGIVIERLIGLGANPNFSYNSQHDSFEKKYKAIPKKTTCLHIAVESHNVEVIKALINGKAIVDAVDAKGNTPMFYVGRRALGRDWTLQMTSKEKWFQ